MIDIETITKLFNTGFTRETPSATSTSEISWNSLSSGTSLLTKEENTINSSILHQEYVDILEKMFTSRAEYYKTIDSISHTDKTLEIVDQLIDEVLNAVNAQEPFTPAILETEPNAEIALQACKELNFNCDIYRYDRDLTKKLIIYGEFFLSTSIKVGKGITELNDLVEAKNILPLYKGYKIQEFIGLLKDFDNSNYVYTLNSDRDKVRIDRNLLTHFAVSPNRYSLKDEKIPELIHKGYSTLVGVSALYPALSRIYKLEQLSTAADMQAMDSVSAQRLIGVPVAPSVKPTDYPELTRTYINFLQPILNNSQGTTNILTALKNSGGFQVLPYPQGQGKPESIEFPAKDLSSLLQRIENLNNGIDKALGLDNSENNNRSQIYAIKSKLIKRLQDIMEARRLGWKEIYLRHLLFKGIYVNPMNFDVQMAALPDYDIFAEAEGISHLIDSIKDAFSFATDVQAMGLFKSIDASCLQNLFDSYVGTRYPTLKGLFGNAVNTIETDEDLDDEDLDDDEYNDMTIGSGGHQEFTDTSIKEDTTEESAIEPEIEEATVEETPQAEVEEVTTEE